MEMLNTGQPLQSLLEMHRLAVIEGTPVRTASGSLLVKSRISNIFFIYFKCYYFKRFRKIIAMSEKNL